MPFSWPCIRQSLLSCCMFMVALAAEDPWGKDADLCRPPAPRGINQKGINPKTSSSCQTALLGPIAEAMIQFHQDIISPCDGPRSHFLPSSSQYTLEAMRKYGFYQGFTMGCDRLMRENSDKWVYKTAKDASGKKMKLNPVP